MFETPGNIAHVWVDGTEIDRFRDLTQLPGFEVESDSGRHYRVVRRPVPDSRTVEWDVLAVGEKDDGMSVGTVTKYNPRFSRNLEYLFKKHGARFNGGSQSDLSNTVQALIE